MSVKSYENCAVPPINVMEVSLLTPQKKPENQRFPDIFRGYRKETFIIFIVAFNGALQNEVSKTWDAVFLMYDGLGTNR